VGHDANERVTTLVGQLAVRVQVLEARIDELQDENTALRTQLEAAQADAAERTR
jgi:outer membrane murein-binding lipoprotein Lpp